MSGTRLNSAHVWLVVAIAVTAAGCGASHDRGDVDAGPRRVGPDGAIVERDAGSRPDSGADAGGVSDAGVRTACSADDAIAALCPELLCDGIPRWYWNGDDCFWIDCGACEGTDCDRGAGSREACLAEHSTCEPALCRATSGSWLWWAQECGHYECGHAPPANCEVGFAVCDCGVNRVFEPGIGCVDRCGEIDPLPRDVMCRTTGGTWGSFCCDSVCGQPCVLACAADACDCGPGRVFDVARGCIESARCHERMLGETCEGAARCATGTVCCTHCGGAGCFRPATCETPVCDSDPHTDACGNRDDVPVP